MKDAGGNVIQHNQKNADKEGPLQSLTEATIDVDDLRIEAEKTPKIAKDIVLEACCSKIPRHGRVS